MRFAVRLPADRAFFGLALLLIALAASACSPKFNYRTLATATSNYSGSGGGGGGGGSSFAQIYRSVGPSDTSVLACGGSDGSSCSNNDGDLDITGTTATFASSLPTNVGVGDVIVYDCTGAGSLGANSCLAFFVGGGLSSSTVAAVQSMSGGAPTTVSSTAVWRIYRAYTSLSGALTGSGQENSAIRAINSTLGNFDSWTTNDLVTNNTQWNIALYADAADTGYGNDTFDSIWTTSPTNYLRIYAPYLSTDVGASQRHSGVWSTSAARVIDGGANSAVLYLTTATGSLNVVIDGLEVENTGTGHTESGLQLYGGGETAASTITVSNCLVYRTSSAGPGSTGLYMTVVANGSANTVYNNIVQGPWTEASVGVYAAGSGASQVGTFIVYNNTIVGGAADALLVSFNGGGPNRLYVKNNISSGNSTDYAINSFGFTGAYVHGSNISSDATSPDSSYQDKTVSFWVTPNGQQSYLLSPADTAAKGQGLNLSGDAEFAFDGDIVDHTRPSTWSIGADEPATEIYRSVGPANTSALATSGGTTTLSISGTTATFGAALPDNIGVGDAVVYGSDSEIAFIVGGGRASSTSFALQSASGGTPTSATNDTTWAIYRAYTSVAKSLTGSGAENSGIPSTVRGFDSGFASNNNLLSNNQQWNIAVYGDATDTYSTSLTMAGWTTALPNDLNIYAPSLSTDVGTSQQHQGSWQTSGAAGISFTGGHLLVLKESNVIFNGLQFSATGNLGGDGCLSPYAFGLSNIFILNNIFNGTGSTGASNGIQVNDTVANVVIANNVLFDWSGNGVTAGENAGWSQTDYIYNNTFASNTGYGIYANNPAELYLQNNIATSDGTADYSDNNSAHYAETVTNLSGDASSPNSGSRSETASFVNAGAGDYRLSPTDAVARDAGTNLSADSNFAFNTDLTDTPRPQGTGWDMGASEAVPSSSDATELLGVTLDSITSTGFTATVGFSGDADSNNSAALYYCDDTAESGCDPLTGTSASMTRGSGSFTYTASISNGDAQNIEVIASDSDGAYHSTISTNLGLQIYRSVGPNNTSALASGSGGDTLTISGRTATFGSAVPNNVGVGDAVVYHSDADIALIIARTSSTEYTLQSASGGAPSAVTGDTTWSIYRAYTSLYDAASGGNGYENAGIPVGVRYFDAWNGGNNIVSADQQWNIALYGDAADTLASGDTIWTGEWTDDPGNFVRIYTPYLSSEVGISQRHNGAWSNAAGRIVNTNVNPGGDGELIVNGDYSTGGDYLRVEGLEIDYGGSNACDGVQAQTVADNLVLYSGSNGGCTILGGTAPGPATEVYNNIVDCGGLNDTYAIMGVPGGSAVYNNTVTGCGDGINLYGAGGNVFVKNNICANSQGDCYTNEYPYFDPTSDYNISSDATTTGGTHDKKNTTVTFVSSADEDFRLSPSDSSGAIDGAESLSEDPHMAFDTDLAGMSRPVGSGWCIGACEAVPSSSTATELLVLTLTSDPDGSGSLGATATLSGNNTDAASATVYWCDNTASSGCDPVNSGSSAAMTLSGSEFTYTGTGLTAGDTYNVIVIATDPDGISGSGLSGTVVP